MFVRSVLILSQDHPKIFLQGIGLPSPPQCLTVPFDVPHVQILHTIHMHAVHDGTVPCLQQDTLAIRSALPLEVVVRHTRKWWDGKAGSRYDDEPIDFTYEVHALPDDWTIGGQKKGHFSAKVSYSGGL